MAMAVIVKLALVSTHFWMVSADQSKSSELSDPLGKVNDLLSTLKAKILKEGEAEAKAYEEFVRWCQTASAETNYEIKNYDKIKEKQEAKVVELASDIEVAISKIEELSGAISTSQGELNEATAIRAKEHSDFLATEKELTEASDALSRAISIISAEMAKNPAVLAQIDKGSISSLLLSLGTVVDAAGVSSSDRQKLLAFVQSKQDQEDEVGAPAGAAYQSQSGDVVTLLENLNEKAEGELADARKVEADSKHNFNMMKQSLENQMAADTKDMNSEKSGKEEAAGEKAKTEGDLAVTMPNLEENKKSLETSMHDCMESASDHEATMAARDEEVKVIAKAIEILKEEAAGAGELTKKIFEKYSFLQTASMTKSTMRTRADLANTEAGAMVKKLAREQHSAALAQLASRISVVAKYGGRDGSNPFDKIKGLISQMITKLEKEAEAEAQEKAWCDEQMGETKSKKAELEHGHAKVVATIDKSVARSAEIKEHARETHEELAVMARNVAEVTSIRREEHANFVKAKADLESGMAGVQRVTEVLTKYYGNSAAFIQEDQPTVPQHSKDGGRKAGGPIIDILEVVTSDFATTLTKEEAQEADADSEHKEWAKNSQDGKIEMEKALQYNKKELAGLEKLISELTNDQVTLDNELSAVLQYYAQVQARCVAQPHSYEDGKARREAEINGLKEALSTLESEAAFVQRKRRMRGGIAALQ